MEMEINKPGGGCVGAGGEGGMDKSINQSMDVWEPGKRMKNKKVSGWEPGKKRKRDL